MEANVEKDCGVLGNLFQTIVNDLRCSSPIWEDFAYKATKLHQCLKTTLVAISCFLEAFQKVADMATNSKGATREIGSALTRLCMRHRSIETCLKALTSSILDSLVVPLQEKLEDWKKVVAQLDKDHAKEYKKARQEIKKAASDTIRIQKKVKKGIPHGKNEMQMKLESALQDVNFKYQQLEETEKNSVRTALIEERGRFCHFITCIKPFVDHEVHLLTEVTHLQEIMHCLCLQASDPHTLPASSEQVIADIKGMDPSAWNIQQPSPPSSPSSLGSRKSSMCSINSINSSSSGSSKSHSPSHTLHKRTASQPPMGTERLTSVSSQDSGFTSQDTLFLRPTTPQSLNLYQASNSDLESTGTESADCDSTPNTPSGHMVTTPTASSSSSTNSLPNITAATPKQERVRPHTISASSEKVFISRPPLKPELFEPLQEKTEQAESIEIMHQSQGRAGGKLRPHSTSSGPYARPAATINKMQPVLPPHCPRTKVKAVPPPSLPPASQPVYANTMDLQRLAMENQARQQAADRKEEEFASQPGVKSDPSTATDTNLNAIDLDEAIRNLDNFTAALISQVPEEDEDEQEEEMTLKEEFKKEEAEKREDEAVELRRTARSQKMHQNNLELAAAIRELEASTAALQSTYGDTSSHTSHSSLQCSSGYATMNSTPCSSEDTIASGDFELSSVSFESEKYFTIPRSGEMSAAYRAALHPKRPASTAGVPASANNLSRRNSVNTSKPPPPVRRTASITGANPPSQRINSSPPRHFQESGMLGSDQLEGSYAELQVIQQSILQQKMPQSQQMPPQTKPGPLLRQRSNESPYPQSPDRASISSSSSGSSSHYAVPNVVPQSHEQVSVIKSLNAKFANLNQQYQDAQFQENFPFSNGGDGNRGDPTAASLMPPPPVPAAVNSVHPAQQQTKHKGHGSQGQGQVHSLSGHPSHYIHNQGNQQGHPHGQCQSRPQGHSQGHLQSRPQGFIQGHNVFPMGQPRSSPQGHPLHDNDPHYTGHGHRGHIGNMYGQVQQQSEGEDFPLPPTAEELAEMELEFSRPPPVTPKPSIQANLMMELKRRVSSEEASDV